MEATITLDTLIQKITIVKSFLDIPEAAKECQSALNAIRFLVGEEMFEKAMAAIEK